MKNQDNNEEHSHLITQITNQNTTLSNESHHPYDQNERNNESELNTSIMSPNVISSYY